MSPPAPPNRQDASFRARPHTEDTARRWRECSHGRPGLTRAADSDTTARMLPPERGTLSPLAQARGRRPAGEHHLQKASRADKGELQGPNHYAFRHREPPPRARHEQHTETNTFPLPKTAPPRRTRRESAAAAQSGGFRVFTRAQGKEGKGDVPRCDLQGGSRHPRRR